MVLLAMNSFFVVFEAVRSRMVESYGDWTSDARWALNSHDCEAAHAMALSSLLDLEKDREMAGSDSREDLDTQCAWHGALCSLMMSKIEMLNLEPYVAHQHLLNAQAVVSTFTGDAPIPFTPVILHRMSVLC